MTRPDTLAVEEPLEIRLDPGPAAEPFTVTMRTPGHDLELALGFLVSRGGRARRRRRRRRAALPRAARDADGVPTPTTWSRSRLRPRRARARAEPRAHVLHDASCGVCGKASIDAVRTRRRTPSRDRRRRGDAGDPGRAARPAARRPARLRPHRRPARRRPVHPRRRAARAARGRRPAQRGRQGGRLGARSEALLPLAGHVLHGLSGRASFELVQKAWMAGMPGARRRLRAVVARRRPRRPRPG